MRARARLGEAKRKVESTTGRKAGEGDSQRGKKGIAQTFVEGRGEKNVNVVDLTLPMPRRAKNCLYDAIYHFKGGALVE